MPSSQAELRVRHARLLRKSRDVFHLKNSGRAVTYRLIFALEQVYVAASQFKAGQHHRRQAQCPKALRADRTPKKARPVEGRRQSHRPAEDEAGCVIGKLLVER